MEAVLTQTLSQTAALHLVGGFSRKRRLQLGPLRAHLLILGFNVILAVLALILYQTTAQEQADGEMLQKTSNADLFVKGMPWTHQVDDLRAGVSVLLHGLARAKVLGFAHQQHLLWVVHCQAHLHMVNTHSKH